MYMALIIVAIFAMVLGVPLLQAMRERYPGVRLHLVESLSGHLAAMLDARQLDDDDAL